MSDSKQKKRKRQSEKTWACASCKKRHEKCSGGSPCDRCAKSNIKCVYPLKRKRGPRVGFRQKYFDRIAELERIVERQNNELDVLRTAPSQQQIYSNSLMCAGVDTQMVNKNVVFRYIDSMYCSEVGNLYSKPPRITTLAYATSHSYHAFSDAAFGAFIEGNTGLKDKFHDMAKKVYTEIDKADILDMTVTAGDLALGAMSLYSGSIEEANKYLLRANKTASRYTVEINQETTGKDRALCRILMFHQLKFTSSPAKQKDIVESLVSGLLSECDGQVGLLSVSDRTMLVLVLSLKVISSIRYIQEQGRSITVAEKAMFYLLLTQAEEGSRYPVATHARVLLHLARTSISIASRNNDRAFKHAERALSILMEMDPSSTVLSTFLLKSLIEVFATIECAEKFMVCLDLMRDLSTKWSLARLMSNVVLAMVSRVPPNVQISLFF